MNSDSPILLLGVGTTGTLIARGVNRAFGRDLRHVLLDTDAHSAQEDEPFILLGGDRLSGRGTGGDVVAGRLATESSIKTLDEHLEGVRLAVIATALGGGTGSGGTLETAKYLTEHGIPTIVFATMPFTCEGEDRQRNARGVVAMIEDAASATFFLPLDKLVGSTDNMNEAMRQAADTLSSGITLFWRLIEKPGYIRLDTERLRHILSTAGRGRFATVTAQGPARVQDLLDSLMRSDLLATSSGPVRATLCGVLAGDDLLLSEVGAIADGIRNSFGGHTFDLATVNDEETFSGRIAVVVMLFEAGNATPVGGSVTSVLGAARPKGRGVLATGQNGRRRFQNVEPTIWNGEDLDVPTFIRKNLNLDF